jgi:hypothetical protein
MRWCRFWQKFPMMKKGEHSTTESKDASRSPSMKETIIRPKTFWLIWFRRLVFRETDAQDLLDTLYLNMQHNMDIPKFVFFNGLYWWMAGIYSRSWWFSFRRCFVVFVGHFSFNLSETSTKFQIYRDSFSC